MGITIFAPFLVPARRAKICNFSLIVNLIVKVSSSIFHELFCGRNCFVGDFLVGASFEDNYSPITHCLYGRAGQSPHRRTAAAQKHNRAL